MPSGADGIKSDVGCNLTIKAVVIWRAGKRLIEVVPRENGKKRSNSVF